MRTMRLLVALTLACGTWACGGETPRTGAVLPGRSRPLLEHNWPHPRDLRIRRDQFEPPDAKPRSSRRRRACAPMSSPTPANRSCRSPRRSRSDAASEQANETGAAEALSRLVAAPDPRAAGASVPWARVQVEQDADLTRVTLTCLPMTGSRDSPRSSGRCAAPSRCGSDRRLQDRARVRADRREASAGPRSVPRSNWRACSRRIRSRLLTPA